MRSELWSPVFILCKPRGTCLTLASQMDHKCISTGMHVAAKFSEEVGYSCFLSLLSPSSTARLIRFFARCKPSFPIDRSPFGQISPLGRALKISPFEVSFGYRANTSYVFRSNISRSWSQFFSFIFFGRASWNANCDTFRETRGRLALLLEIHGNHVCRCDPKIQPLVVSSPTATRESPPRTLPTQFRIIFENR